MNAWLKKCVLNLDLNRESLSEPRTLSGRLFQSLGAKYEKVLPPLVDFAILGTTKQGRCHHFKSGGDGMSSVIPVFFSVNPCLIDRFYF